MKQCNIFPFSVICIKLKSWQLPEERERQNCSIIRNIDFLLVHIFIIKGHNRKHPQQFFSCPPHALLWCLSTAFTFKWSYPWKRSSHKPFILLMRKQSKICQFVSPFQSPRYIKICICFLQFLQILCTFISHLIFREVELSECLYEKRKMKMKEMKRLILSHCVLL
jgi:hypothetical protein